MDGGLTRSVAFMQAVANLTGLPIDVYPSSHATPLGRSPCCGRLNPELSLSQAVVSWQPATSYEPAWSSDRAAQFRQRWRSAVELSLKAGQA